MKTVYVLKLEQNKWYVGSTSRKNVQERIEEHANVVSAVVSGKAAEWVKKYPYVSTFMTIPGDEFDEDKFTKIFMGKYGIENVRGGCYCQLVLTELDIKFITREIWSAQGKCFTCGGDHFTKEGEYAHFIGERDCIYKKFTYDTLDDIPYHLLPDEPPPDINIISDKETSIGLVLKIVDASIIL